MAACLTFILLLFVAQHGLQASSYMSQFEAFELKFGKSYKDASERLSRFAIFAKNLEEIEEHNLKNGSLWRKGITKFADMTKDEFSKAVNGFIPASTLQPLEVKSADLMDVKDLPESVDWRDKGAISDIKDQDFCGSCWAFASIQQIESYMQINTGKPIEPLSPEHIVACSPNPLKCGGNGGCEGSVTQLGFLYTQLFGLTSEADYPYTSGYYGKTDDCIYDPDTMDVLATTRGYEVLPRNDYQAVMNHLANVGPLAVAVAASDWGLYFDGVFDGCSYDENIEINHAVQLVGYGTDPQLGDYWLIRNSWGNWWGQGGYMKLKREANPPCGTNNTPLMGSGCVDDGNDVVTVCGQCGVLFDVLYPIGSDYVE